MFRWPLDLTPLSLGSLGTTREAVLEVSPRGAAFTLACLSHVGHGAHLALIDAYLKGQVRLTATSAIGEDCRTVAASLATPLLAAYELGVERLTLRDLVLLPRDPDAALTAGRAAGGGPTRSPDCARLLLRIGSDRHRVRGAERFEQAGCLGTRNVGVGEPWLDVIAELPEPGEIEARARAGRWPAPILAEVREASICIPLPPAHAPESGPLPPTTRVTPAEPERGSLVDLISALTEAIGVRRALMAWLRWQRMNIAVVLTPELDGYQTLGLIPPADAEPTTMRDATWELIGGLIGRALPERRTEPFALRLIGSDRTITLDVGESVVIGRNQVVFAAWVGTDGRVMVRLLPPGGMRASG